MSMIDGVVLGSSQNPMYVRPGSGTASGTFTTTLLPAGATAFTAVSAADITGTSSTAVKAAGASGVVHYITAITVSNLAAAVATRVDILDGATVIWSGPAAAAGGGFCITFGIPKAGTAATAINAQCGTTAAQVRVAIAGYSI